MKYTLSTLLACLVLPCTFAQHNFQFKVYHNSDFFTSTYKSSTAEREVTHTNFDRFTLAIAFGKRNTLLHEIEFFMPDLSKPFDEVSFPMHYEFHDREGTKNNISTYSIRYELSRLFNPTKTIFVGLGLAVNPYYTHAEYEPENSTVYRSTNELIGVSLNVVPRLLFNVSERFRIDINVPLKVYNMSYNKYHISNPAIPIRQQEVEAFSNLFFERSYTIRFGVAYLLKH